MEISSSAINDPIHVRNRTWMTVLRWICVVPSYVVIGVATFTSILCSSLFLGRGDDGTSWFSIVIIVFASSAAITGAALVAPSYKLVVAVLFALATVWIVPYPYTIESSSDGEAIPSRYEIVGVVLGSEFAIGGALSVY